MFKVVIGGKVISLTGHPIEDLVDQTCSILQVTKEDFLTRDLIQAVAHQYLRFHYLDLPFFYSSTVRDVLLGAGWLINDTSILVRIREVGEEAIAQFSGEVDGHKIGDIVTHGRDEVWMGPIVLICRMGNVWGASICHMGSWFPLSEITKCP